MLNTFLKDLHNFLFFIFGEGSWKFLKHERVVVDSVVKFLEKENQHKVQHQLAHRYFVNRVPDGKVNLIRLYVREPSNRLPSPEFEDLLYKVKIKLDGRLQTCNVTFYEGFIFSVEFRKPKDFYRDKEVKVVAISKGKSSDTITRAIDRSEHGREESDE